MEPQAAVAAKIAAIYGEIQPMKKDAKNSFFKYEYLSEAAIKAAMLPLMAKHKLVFRFVRFTDVQRTPFKTRNGESQKLTATAHFEFMDGETGQREPVEMMIEAIDDQDKGFQKALTNAQKYVLFGTFMLPTGDPKDDSEHDGNNTEPEPRTRREPVQAPPSETVNPEIQKLWDKMTGQKEAIAAIMHWQPVVGDTVYRAILSKYGIEYATDVRKPNVARAIVADLYTAHHAQEMRAA